MSEERKSLNAADLKAARRLIEQFEEKADGRHNSTAMPHNRPTWTHPALAESANELTASESSHRQWPQISMSMRRDPLNFTPQDGASDPLVDLHTAVMWIPSVLSPPPIRERSVTIKTRWQDCEIGEYWRCQINAINDLNPIPKRLAQFDPTDPNNPLWVFEPATLWNRESGAKQYWKRIA